MKKVLISLLTLTSLNALATNSTLYMIYSPGVRQPSMGDVHDGIKGVDGSRHFEVEIPELEKYDSYSCNFLGYAKINGTRVDENEGTENEYYDAVSMSYEYDETILDYSGELSAKYNNFSIMSMFEVPASFDRIPIEPLYTQTVVANNNFDHVYLESGVFSIDQARRSGTASSLRVGTRETLFLNNFYYYKENGISSPEEINFLKLEQAQDDESLSYIYEYEDSFDKSIVYGVEIQCIFDDYSES